MSQQILDRIKCEGFPGETYQHYKGKIVSVLGAVHATLPTRIRDMQVFAIARWTDVAGRKIQIFRDDAMSLRFPHSLDAEPLVLYACSGDLWVRPVSEFLGEASPGVSRFTRVGAKFLNAKNSASGLEELPHGANNLPEILKDDFPDDLKEFAAQRCPQGVLAFYQEVMPAYVGTCEEMGWAAPTAIAAILDDIGTYGVIDCVKIDGQWRQKNGCMGLLVRCLVNTLEEQARIRSAWVNHQSYLLYPGEGELEALPPLPLHQELGIDD